MAKIHRFIDNFDLSKKELKINGEIAHQIIKILKLKIGEKIELSNGKGKCALTTISRTTLDIVEVEIEKTWEDKDQIKNNVTLFCAILKKENFEFVVQKTTECGISKIVPIISDRTIKTGLNLERLQKIAKEASEQSGRSNVPEIIEPITFDKSLELVKNNINLLFHADGELPFEIHCAGWRAEHSKFSAENYVCISKDNSLSANKNNQINIFIGPEGGWTEKEIEKIKNLNFKIATLGPLILRGETAAIISTYLAVNI